MIHVRSEGQFCRYGLNLYPWAERRSSVGFVLRLWHHRIMVRFAPRIHRFYVLAERCPSLADEHKALASFLQGHS